MEKKSLPIVIFGGLMAFIGFIATLGILVMIPGALFKHISLSAFLTKMDLGKEDCLGLILPALALYWVNVVHFFLVWIAGVGIAFTQEWARRLLLTLAYLDLIWLAGDILIAHKHVKLSENIESAVILGVIIFLSLPPVKRQFKKEEGTP